MHLRELGESICNFVFSCGLCCALWRKKLFASGANAALVTGFLSAKQTTNVLFAKKMRREFLIGFGRGNKALVLFLGEKTANEKGGAVNDARSPREGASLMDTHTHLNERTQHTGHHYTLTHQSPECIVHNNKWQRGR